MSRRIIRTRRASLGALGAMALVLFCLVEARAQQDLSRPKAEVKLGGGISTFGGAANDNYRHTVVAGSMRIYVYRRLSIEPEVMYMQRGEFDRDWYSRRM